MTHAEKAALGSIAVGLAALGLKFLAWALTGSVALYSDAVESIINVAAAAVAFVALRIAHRPADPGHPYGHQKAEYFSAVLEGVLVVIAALAILREAWAGLADPHPLDAPALGLALNAGASVLNGAWSAALIRFGRRWRSPALVADGKHLLTDVVTSIGVLAGVGLVALTGWLVLDPVLAGLVALNVLWTGWGLVRESASSLLDAAAPPEMLALIRRIIAAEAGGALEAHAVRTRLSGRTTFLEFHIVVPRAMTVGEAHAICDRVESALAAAIPHLDVVIHVEPEEQAELSGVPVAL
jgi:cation diffusion facilitator family transporter